jgi:hypothetical protein
MKNINHGEHGDTARKTMIFDFRRVAVLAVVKRVLR